MRSDQDVSLPLDSPSVFPSYPSPKHAETQKAERPTVVGNIGAARCAVGYDGDAVADCGCGFAAGYALGCGRDIADNFGDGPADAADRGSSK
jgi:hypothetical protein